MLEILHFVFSDFWHWLGATVMLSIVSGGIAFGLASARGLLFFHQDLHR